MSRKNVFGIFIIFFFSRNVIAQEPISVVSSFTAYTHEKALSGALRSVLEMASGLYIQSKTVIQNDELVFDEVSSLSTGTIKKYTIINELKNEKNGEISLTINALIEPGKFKSLLESKGINVEFSGSAFVENLKLNNYYKEQEAKIIFQFVSDYIYLDTINNNNGIKLPLYDCFDRKIELLTKDPLIYHYTAPEYTFLDSFTNDWEYDWSLYEDDAMQNINIPFIKIANIEYKNPFSFFFKSDKYKLDANSIQADINEQLITISAIDEIFRRKKNWSNTEKKQFGKLDQEKAKEFYYYTITNRLDSLKKSIEKKLLSTLKSYENNYVVNLSPRFIPNSNYTKLMDALTSLLASIAINKDSDFSKSDYEQKFGPTYNIYLAERKNEKIIRKEYVLRNSLSIKYINSLRDYLYIKQKGSDAYQQNLLKTNLGYMKKILCGDLYTTMVNENEDYYTGSALIHNSILIINPDSNSILVDQNNRVIHYPKKAVSAFYTLEDLSKINEYTIDNTPITYTIPVKEDMYVYDKRNNFMTKEEINALDKKLKEIKQKIGVEIYVVYDYDFEESSYELNSLAEDYIYDWHIGSENKKGIIFILAPKIKRWNFLYCIGLDDKIDIKYCEKLKNQISPLFKQGVKHYDKLNTAVDILYNKVK